MKDACMTKCINTLINQILSKYLCHFRQGSNTQHCLPVMVEKWKEALDKGGLGDARLTDLSKAFDYIKHDLSIAKLTAYGLDSYSLSFIFSYLNER